MSFPSFRRFECSWFARIACLLAATVGASAASAKIELKEGDRVVFYGDSITEQRLYTRYLQQYVHCRYPSLNVRFFNAGWGGDTAPGALRRLERDVLVLKPTVVTLFFGMNDGRYKATEPATLRDYRAGMEGLLKAFKEKGVQVVVFTPGAVDTDQRANLKDVNYNATLKALGDVCRELGQQYGVEVVDVHEPMLAFQAAGKSKDPKFTVIPDSVHPNALGHLVMARAMLPALADPMPELGTLDIAADKATNGIRVQKQGDSWLVTARTTTPFWIEEDSREAVAGSEVSSFIAPTLKLTGLPEGKYRVEVERTVVRLATHSELAEGVSVPLHSPAGKALHDLIRVKEDNYFSGWRQLRLPLGELPGVDRAVEASMRVDDAMAAAIHQAARASQEISIRIGPVPAGPNLALKKPYEASDANRFSWGIGGLTDGSWEASSRHCFATGDQDEFPKSVTVDLGQVQTLGEVHLGVPPFGSTRHVRVELSEDGQNYAEVGQHEFAQREAARHRFAFAPRPARFIKLVYPDHYSEEAGYSPTFAFTTELEAYAPQAGSPAR